MSESALAAATRPQSYGSSSTGVKKSAVATTARSPSIRTTAASSPSSSPTSRSASGADQAGEDRVQLPRRDLAGAPATVRILGQSQGHHATLPRGGYGRTGGVQAAGAPPGLQNRCGPGPGPGGFDSRPPPPSTKKPR